MGKQQAASRSLRGGQPGSATLQRSAAGGPGRSGLTRRCAAGRRAPLPVSRSHRLSPGEGTSPSRGPGGRRGERRRARREALAGAPRPGGGGAVPWGGVTPPRYHRRWSRAAPWGSARISRRVAAPRSSVRLAAAAARLARPEMTDALPPRGCQAAEPAADGYFRKVRGAVAGSGGGGLCARSSPHPRGRFRVWRSRARCRRSVVSCVPRQPAVAASRLWGGKGGAMGTSALAERGRLARAGERPRPGCGVAFRGGGALRGVPGARRSPPLSLGQASSWGQERSYLLQNE